MTTRQTRKKTMTTELVGTTRATAPRSASAVKGHVSFVGTGPGDASLLTVRAADLLRQADIVVTELPEQAAFVDSDVEIVDGSVGEDGETLTHAARAKLVVKLAKTGAHVVRLISGDPFTYSTGPEEAAACAKAGIGFEIVPGVSSVSAVPAYAGVHTASYVNQMVDSFDSAVSSAISSYDATQSSSSSGGGGGFSGGGGGGGGGGGSW